MVHGLFGTRDNWKEIGGLLADHLDRRSTLLFVSHCNERQKTFDGIDACGERLADEIRGVAAQHLGLRRISLLGHSMGGLISRYAAGRLFDPASGTVAGLAPCHFVAMATPHLACDARYNPAQVPLINWISGVMGVGGVVGSVVSELAAPVSSITMGRAGLQFFLQDGGQQAQQVQQPQQVQQQGQAQAQQGGGDGGSASSGSAVAGPSGRAAAQQPLLYRLTQDCPKEGLHFMSALRAFETRTLYANSSGDHLVGWANSSLRRLAELPAKSGRGAGVVREDPLEAAWWPEARARLHATPAAAALHSGEARRHSEAEVLAADSPRQLAASGTQADAGRRGNDSAALAGQQQQQQQPQAQQQAQQPPSAQPQRPGGPLQETSAEVAAEEGGRERLVASATAAAAAGAAAAALVQALGQGGVRAVQPAEGERQVEEMLGRLQALPWRRVDVCFGATLLPLLSHQHIQMQRWWVNWPGRAVIQHLALSLEAMETLRQQGGTAGAAGAAAGAGGQGLGGQRNRAELGGLGVDEQHPSAPVGAAGSSGAGGAA
ncbi:lipase [Micractinium conductrix]|uniref:Lipase n=1 Tax=Micractinium conductrix TaxID=554055 RepID=A0A2P6V4H2_9CHLO|nr:lipase [Micractinium conductrix]|eukprot:PSC68977.1 lipase [Micractinium conductrix]